MHLTTPHIDTSTFEARIKITENTLTTNILTLDTLSGDGSDM